MLRRMVLLAVTGWMVAAQVGCSGGAKDVPATNLNQPIIKDGAAPAGVPKEKAKPALAQ